MESVPPPPFAAAAMFSCCSMMAAPIEAKLMTSAMICRWRDRRRRLSASVALTPCSRFVVVTASLSTRSRRMIAATSTAQTTMSAALGRRRLTDPNRCAEAASAEPATPPSGAPPATKPNSRLACRGSYTTLASVQNWLIRSTPRISPAR